MPQQPYKTTVTGRNQHSLSCQILNINNLFRTPKEHLKKKRLKHKQPIGRFSEAGLHE